MYYRSERLRVGDIVRGKRGVWTMNGRNLAKMRGVVTAANEYDKDGLCEVKWDGTDEAICACPYELRVIQRAERNE